MSLSKMSLPIDIEYLVADFASENLLNLSDEDIIEYGRYKLHKQYTNPKEVVDLINLLQNRTFRYDIVKKIPTFAFQGTQIPLFEDFFELLASVNEENFIYLFKDRIISKENYLGFNYKAGLSSVFNKNYIISDNPIPPLFLLLVCFKWKNELVLSWLTDEELIKGFKAMTEHEYIYYDFNIDGKNLNSRLTNIIYKYFHQCYNLLFKNNKEFITDGFNKGLIERHEHTPDDKKSNDECMVIFEYFYDCCGFDSTKEDVTNFLRIKKHYLPDSIDVDTPIEYKRIEPCFEGVSLNTEGMIRIQDMFKKKEMYDYLFQGNQLDYLFYDDIVNIVNNPSPLDIFKKVFNGGKISYENYKGRKFRNITRLEYLYLILEWVTKNEYSKESMDIYFSQCSISEYMEILKGRIKLRQFIERINGEDEEEDEISKERISKIETNIKELFSRIISLPEYEEAIFNDINYLTSIFDLGVREHVKFLESHSNRILDDKILDIPVKNYHHYQVFLKLFKERMNNRDFLISLYKILFGISYMSEFQNNKTTTSYLINNELLKITPTIQNLQSISESIWDDVIEMTYKCNNDEFLISTYENLINTYFEIDGKKFDIENKLLESFHKTIEYGEYTWL